MLQEVAAGRRRRVMIFCPPRHGKSELVSRLFSAYYLAADPGRWVGLCSYSAELAVDLAREARMHYVAAGGELREDQHAARNWRTASGGGMWAAGAGGPITGRGFHLGIVDDPIKNAEDAASSTIRRRHQEWWQSTFRTRAEPSAAIIVIQTRWHMDDLSGWLLAREGGEATERWHVVHLPAVAEPPPPLPATCTREPDWRRDGEPLCPERYSLAALERLRGASGPYYWSAMYQQRPAPRTGGMFERHHLRLTAEVPAGEWQWVRYWDKAATAGGEGARTAGALVGRQGTAYLLADLVSGRWAAPDRERIIMETALLDRARCGRVETWVEQEPGSGGKESAEATCRLLAAAGLICRAEIVRGDKALRAEPLAAAAAAGAFSVLVRPWTDDWLDEACSFPAGALKDQVDATSGAFNRLAGRGAPGSVPSPW